MYFKLFQLSRVYRFRRFTRKAYAAFQSMHKQVTIGHVSGKIANLELLKAGKTLLFSTMALTLSVPSWAEEETDADKAVDPALLQIQEVSVVAERSRIGQEHFRLVSNISHEQIAALPIHTASDLLKYLPGIDLRERGASGVQADLSIRGGTGRQVKILLNGVDITDPQTDHYSMDLPVDASLIDHIEILEGTNYALDAFSGAINIVTIKEKKASQKPNAEIFLSMQGGEYGLLHPEAALRTSKGEWWLNSSASYNQSSGYDIDTDYKMSNLFLQTGYKGIAFQVGAQQKDAGANAFYTVKYPNQFDQTRTLVSSLTYEHRWGDWSIDGNIYYRGHFDRFHTYRDGVDLEGNPAPEWYKGPNQTWTHVAGGHLQGSYCVQTPNYVARTNLGIDFREEMIQSNSLGNHNRLHLHYFAEERIYWRGLTAAIGASGIWNSQFGNNWAVGANIAYEPAKNLQLFLSVNRAIRVPTYTDLYYHTATQQADSLTKPEKAWQVEASVKYKHPLDKQYQTTKIARSAMLYLQASGYYRWGRDIIDWVKDPSPDVNVWLSTNHSRVNGAGVEATIGVEGFEWIRRAELSYSFTDVQCDAGKMLSLYALDYLRHKATFRLEHKIYKGFGATWCLRVENRRGEYTATDGTVTAYRPVVLLDGSLYWQNHWLKISLNARNMTNTRYVDIGGVMQPPHWVNGKIEVKLFRD